MIIMMILKNGYQTCSFSTIIKIIHDKKIEIIR